MKIETLELQNFRKFANQNFTFHPQFTVLAGDNATGKTQILDALSIILGTYLLRLGGHSGRTGIAEDEIRLEIYDKKGVITQEPQEPVILRASGILHEKGIQWERRFKDRGGNAKQVVKMGENDRFRVQKGDDVDLPVLRYYGTGRLWDKHRKVEIGKPDSRTVGYRNCLDSQSDHHLFEKWFKHLELSALQQNKKMGVLEAVREAVKTCIPGARKIYFDVAHDALMVELKSEGHCLFNNLSDGYRTMTAMVADIAHRAARLNPHMEGETVRNSSGIVLIDELDLHLHPKWQRQVVDDLRTTFPKIQFIATTHSPFIIQSLEPGMLIDLNRIDESTGSESTESEKAINEVGDTGSDPVGKNRIAYPSPNKDYSNKSIEDISEDVMGIDIPQRSERFQKMYEVATQYYQILQQANGADQKKKEELNTKLNKLSAPFSDNVAYHAFLEMERLSAGLGDVMVMESEEN